MNLRGAGTDDVLAKSVGIKERNHGSAKEENLEITTEYAAVASGVESPKFIRLPGMRRHETAASCLPALRHV